MELPEDFDCEEYNSYIDEMESRGEQELPEDYRLT